MSRENISYYLDWELSVCPKLHSYQFTYPSSFPIKKSIIKTTAFRSFGLLVFVFKRVTRSTTGRESVSLGTELDTVNVKKKKRIAKLIFFYCIWRVTAKMCGRIYWSETPWTSTSGRRPMLLCRPRGFPLRHMTRTSVAMATRGIIWQ